MIFLFVVILFSVTLVSAAPTISWSPTSVAQTVFAGGSRTLTVSFTASESLTNVAVWIVPELQPYVSAAPASFSSITAGTPITITLTFSAASNAPLQTFDGTLHLRDNSGKSNKTYAQSLPITVTIQPLPTQPAPSDFSQIVTDPITLQRHL